MATVMLTGAAGYLGSWVLKLLLEAGHRVHATVRDASDAAKTAHLQALQAAHPGQLIFFEADLLKEDGRFERAAAGCELLIHTASPYRRDGVRDGQRELIDPALIGTRQVLDAASRSGSVRRVVLTSSVVAMSGSLRETLDAHEGRLDERCWNGSSTAVTDPYAFAKTQAERLAWQMQQAQAGKPGAWDLVVINPAAIFGPSLSTRVDAQSVQMVMQFAKGQFASGVPDLQLGIVDVRDVAQAHLEAAFRPGAKGRHLLLAEPSTLLEIGQQIAQSFPALRKCMPGRTLPRWLISLVGPLVGLSRDFVRNNVGLRVRYEHGRSVEALGLHYRKPAQTLVDHITQLRDVGLIQV